MWRGRRLSFRPVPAELFGDRIFGVMENGRAHRLGQLHRPHGGKGTGAMGELEHDPVAGGVGLLRPFCLRGLGNGPVANIRVWQRAGSGLAMTPELALEFGELARSDAPQALPDIAPGHNSGVRRIRRPPGTTPARKSVPTG